MCSLLYQCTLHHLHWKAKFSPLDHQGKSLPVRFYLPFISPSDLASPCLPCLSISPALGLMHNWCSCGLVNSGFWTLVSGLDRTLKWVDVARGPQLLGSGGGLRGRRDTSKWALAPRQPNNLSGSAKSLSILSLGLSFVCLRSKQTLGLGRAVWTHPTSWSWQPTSHLHWPLC